MADFTVDTAFLAQGKLLIHTPTWDFDSFPVVGEELVSLLSATVKERQIEADLHTWLVDFEGSLLLLKAEHYSEAIWLETLSGDDDHAVIRFIATLLAA
ncbi:MAG: DUF3630 family protein [Vibrio sp.]